MTIALHPTPSLFAPPITGEAARELAFTALVEAAAARLRAETRTWAEGLRQDAVESAPRIAWWRLVWTGLRVPVHAMFYQHARRRLDLCVASLARDTALLYGAEVDALQAEAARAIGPAVRPAALDLLLRRELWEGEVTWRRRLEATLLDHLAEVRERQIVDTLLVAAERLRAAVR